MDNFICTKCYKIKEVQEKITDLRMKIYQMTEPNTASKEATKRSTGSCSVPWPGEKSAGVSGRQRPAGKALSLSQFPPKTSTRSVPGLARMFQEWLHPNLGSSRAFARDIIQCITPWLTASPPTSVDVIKPIISARHNKANRALKQSGYSSHTQGVFFQLQKNNTGPFNMKALTNKSLSINEFDQCLD